RRARPHAAIPARGAHHRDLDRGARRAHVVPTAQERRRHAARSDPPAQYARLGRAGDAVGGERLSPETDRTKPAFDGCARAHPFARGATHRIQQERITTGNPQADVILGGGFPKNSINIVMGQPGTGKTIFAEQLVFENASDDRPIVYLTTLSEPLTKMVSYLQRFAFFDEAKIGSAV